MSGSYAPEGYVAVPQAEDFEQENSIPGERGTHVHQHGLQHWSSGICACCDDIPICCLGCWCPCVLFGCNVQMLENRLWVGPCVIHLLLWGVVTVVGCALTESTLLGILASCVPCYACNYRREIRSRYNLEDEPCGDVLTHMCCHSCANCQEYRELLERKTIEEELPEVRPPSVQTMEAS